jgi:hypothetical protein
MTGTDMTGTDIGGGPAGGGGKPVTGWLTSGTGLGSDPNGEY